MFLQLQHLLSPVYSKATPTVGSSTLAVHKQAFHSIAKCVATLTIMLPQEASAVVEQFISDVKVTICSPFPSCFYITFPVHQLKKYVYVVFALGEETQLQPRQ